MDPQVQQQGTGIHRKIGPLEVWHYGAILGAVLVYVWWRNRQSASADATSSGSGAVDNADYGYSTGDMNSGDYASGYDYGYAAGLNANGDVGSATGSGSGGGTTSSQGNAKGPIAHNKFTAKTKDPSGKTVTATGYGTWVKGSGGGWKWQPGIPKQFALMGNGTSQQANVAAAGGDNSNSDGAATLSQATGTSTAATTAGSTSGSAPAKTPAPVIVDRTLTPTTGILRGAQLSYATV
jgi:hypothetical protein